MTWGEFKKKIGEELESNGMGNNSEIEYIDFDPELTKIITNKKKNSFYIY